MLNNKTIKIMEVKKKYELTSETIEFNGITLHRIKALKDFSYVKEGDLGGWIEKEDNLSQIDDAWIGGNAKVFGDAQVYDYAQVFCDAEVYGNAQVYGNAEVYDNVGICGDAIVCGNARVFGDAQVYDCAIIHGNAAIYENAHICEHTIVRDCARIYGASKIYGNTIVSDNAKVFENAEVCGNAEVFGNAEICGDAVVKNNEDYIVFKNFWSSGRYFTWTRSNNMFKVGCFYGTGKELIEKAYKDSERSGKEYKKIVRYVDSILADE